MAKFLKRGSLKGFLIVSLFIVLMTGCANETTGVTPGNGGTGGNFECEFPGNCVNGTDCDGSGNNCTKLECKFPNNCVNDVEGGALCDGSNICQEKPTTQCEFPDNCVNDVEGGALCDGEAGTCAEKDGDWKVVEEGSEQANLIAIADQSGGFGNIDRTKSWISVFDKEFGVESAPADTESKLVVGSASSLFFYLINDGNSVVMYTSTAQDVDFIFDIMFVKGEGGDRKYQLVTRPDYVQPGLENESGHVPYIVTAGDKMWNVPVSIIPGGTEKIFMVIKQYGNLTDEDSGGLKDKNVIKIQ